MTYRTLLAAIVLIVAAGFVVPPEGEAQGKGRPKAPKVGKAPTSPTPTTISTPTTTATTSTVGVASTPAPDLLAPVITFPQFGSWLDDASAPARGEGHMSIGVGHWRMSGMSQTNVPMLGAGFGVTDRMQVSASVPFYRANFEGSTARGMDDVYVSAKYTVVDPALTLSEVGLAVSPVVEVLSAGAPGGRVHFALPVSVEVRRAPFRIYGSTGYFTRGSFFTGGALEWTAPNRLTFTGALTQSYSLKEDAVLDGVPLGKQRMDVTTSVAYPIGQAAAAYVSVGRSLSSLEEGGTSLALSGGVSFSFSAARPTP